MEGTPVVTLNSPSSESQKLSTGSQHQENSGQNNLTASTIPVSNNRPMSPRDSDVASSFTQGSNASSVISTLKRLMHPRTPMREESRISSITTTQQYGSDEQDEPLTDVDVDNVDETIPSDVPHDEQSLNHDDQSATSHHRYDGRTLAVVDSRLIEVRKEKDTSYDDDSVEMPQKKGFQRALCLDEDSIHNIKHRAKVVFKKRTQKQKSQVNVKSKANKGKKKTRGGKAGKFYNDITPRKGNTDDFQLRALSTKKRVPSHQMLHDMLDVEMSDVSDIDQQDAQFLADSPNYTRGLRQSLTAHMSNIPQVVQCVKRGVSNMYTEVNLIMEENSRSRESIKSISSHEHDSLHENDDRNSISTPPPLNERNVSLERHTSDLGREGVKDRTFSDFQKITNMILRESAHSSDFDSQDVEASLHQSRSTIGIDASPRPNKVREMVKAIDARHAIQTGIAAGTHGPSTPRTKIAKGTITSLRKAPPASVFKQQEIKTPNDFMKIIFLGGVHSNDKKSRIIHTMLSQKGKYKKLWSGNKIDVRRYCWEPEQTGSQGDLYRLGFGQRTPKYNLFDLKGGAVNSGLHHSMQSLFFSPDSLYIIVWDLAIHNHKLNRLINETKSSRSELHDDDSCDDDDDDSYDEYNPEHITLLKNKENTIIRDIEDNVLYWIDVISEPNFSGCAIMPIILHSASIDKQETSYRVNLLHKCLQDHRNRAQARRQSLPMLALGENDKIPIVSLLSPDDDNSSASRGNITTTINHHSVDELRRAILNITSIEYSNKTGIFKHLYAPMTPLQLAVKDILATFREMKQKVVRFDDIYVALSRNPPVGDHFSRAVVQEALAFLSTIGEVVYFGDQAPLCADPVLLKQYVVLDPRWLSFAIGCVLAPDEIKDIRDKDAVSGFGDIYSNHNDDPFESLSIRPSEAVEIWESKPQISSQCALTDDSDSQAGQLYMFLQQVCEHNGIFMPIGDDVCNRDFYVLPRVVAEPLDSGSPWTFKTRENHKTVICHSWVMGGNLPPSFMDEITQGVLTVLNDMYKDSKTDQVDSRHGRAQGIYVEQVLCYKTAIYMKIVEISFSYKTKEMVSSIAEIYVHLASVDSPNCVGVKTMRSSDRKLILCGKGFAGNNGAKIWTLGYEAIRKAVDWAVKGKLNDGFSREVGCPECLLTKDPRDAAMWKEASVLIAGNECILCSNQAQVHRVDPRILRGEFIQNHLDDESCSIKSGFSQFSLISHYSAVSQSIYDGSGVKPSKNVVDIRPSVVLVGIWDTKQGLITSLGSGFIADTQRGLIITAGHTFYQFEADKSIGPKYHGIDGARAIIGVYESSTESALFQYTADIVTEDLENVDACVLRLKSKFESPLKADGNRISYPQAEVGILNPKADGLRRLGMTDKVELESSVRMIGYDQEGDEIYHVEGVDYSPCYRAGRVIKKSDRRCTSSQSSHSSGFISNNNMTDNIESIRYHCPSLWIKAHLRTRHGHSGGPVVNDAGLVIGIVSSADHEEEELCYLAPSKLLYSLLKKARKEVNSQTGTVQRVRFSSRD